MIWKKTVNTPKEIPAASPRQAAPFKAVKTNFSDKRALALLYKLEKTTVELVVLSREIISLTGEFEEKWLQK
jgi:hypothetical protein